MIRPVTAIALVASLLALAPASQAHRAAAGPSLSVTFTPAGVITVTLPDGTPVGSTSGTPTLIPAGYYTLLFYGPGECINLPLFELKGPGVNINDDMLGGETDVHTLYANFAPNTTYTWHSDRNASVVYSFRTSSTVAASQSSTSTTSTTSSSSSAKPTSEDITGSDIVPFRGTLTAGVTSGGKLTLVFKGKPVTALKAGRYTIAVTDKSPKSGFVLAKIAHKPMTVTGAAFVGRHSASVRLTTGKWVISPHAGANGSAISVS